MYRGAAMAQWLSSWLAKQEVQGSIPRLVTWISGIGYLLLPSQDMSEIPLKRRKSSLQQINQPIATKPTTIECREHIFVLSVLCNILLVRDRDHTGHA